MFHKKLPKYLLTKDRKLDKLLSYVCISPPCLAKANIFIKKLDE